MTNQERKREFESKKKKDIKTKLKLDKKST